jgi:hypothetical protein
MVSISQMANISAPEPRVILIQPWEKSSLKAIEKAILKSDLGLTPSNDGSAIRLIIAELTEETISSEMYLAGQPEPELIIRTGGERRLSNFLMWQSGYSELYFTGKLWPDFDKSDVDAAIAYYNEVKRNFGK